MNEMIPYSAERALAKHSRENYTLSLCGAELTLKRGTDFDNPEQSNGRKAFKQPILLKAGAEKIAFGFGLLQQYEMVNCVERYDQNGAYFAYTVRCDLVKLGPNGEKIVVSNSYGHANSAESRNGFKSGPDAANGSIKMAQKRALVGAALAISGLSDLFTQDIENDSFMKSAENITKVKDFENDSFMKSAENITKVKDDDPISSKQIQRIYAIAGSKGLTTPEAKQLIISLGFASTKDIKQKDYDSVCKAIEDAGK